MKGLCLTLLVLLCLLEGCQKHAYLKCSGSFFIGQEETKDEFFLEINGKALSITGEPGTLSSFDGKAYQVCSDQPDLILFSHQDCNANLLKGKVGRLTKASGHLLIENYSMTPTMLGNYECRAAKPVIPN